MIEIIIYPGSNENAPGEEVLPWPYAYNRDVDEFVKFLERGKAKYKELYPQ